MKMILGRESNWTKDDLIQEFEMIKWLGNMKQKRGVVIVLAD